LTLTSRVKDCGRIVDEFSDRPQNEQSVPWNQQSRLQFSQLLLAVPCLRQLGALTLSIVENAEGFRTFVEYEELYSWSSAEWITT
jgi:hypothetical protein